MQPYIRYAGPVLAIVIVISSIIASVPRFAASQSGSTPITGYAWSDTIGWIDLNCANSGVCGTNNFGLSISQNGNISGYAWSDNVGWVSANASDLTGCPSGPCNAAIANSSLQGWLKAIAADNNGWDGWISLSGSNYGPVLSNGAFSGYAWAGDVLGWVDFSLAKAQAQSCAPNYYCTGTAQYYQNAQCTSTLQTTCPYECSNGSCIAAPSMQGTISTTPTLVRSNSTVTVSWIAANASSCKVTGTNGDSWSGTSESQISGAIADTTVFTLTCTDLGGASSVLGTASVHVVPTWQEL
jgi:hypothetical protein